MPDWRIGISPGALISVIPAKAGISQWWRRCEIPAFAGMTMEMDRDGEDEGNDRDGEDEGDDGENGSG